MKLCWFKRFWPHECGWRADGQPDRCHLLPKQRIKAELRARGFTAKEIAAVVWDGRLYVPGCRKAHTAFDNKLIPLLEDDYPPPMREWANANGFYFVDPRTGWVHDAKEAA